MVAHVIDNGTVAALPSRFIQRLVGLCQQGLGKMMGCRHKAGAPHADTHALRRRTGQRDLRLADGFDHGPGDMTRAVRRHVRQNRAELARPDVAGEIRPT